MTNFRYAIVILPLNDEEGAGYMAYAPDLPGCMGDGETQEEAASDLSSAINEWIDEAGRLGRPVPLPGSFLEAAKADRKRIDDILAAQDSLIREQEGVIRQQGEGLGTPASALATSALSVGVPVSGWVNAAAFTVFNPARDASPSREVLLPSALPRASA